tara:strand:- start:2179 stop:2469 length:291 start_codon:yes stop_codon:yes gene_type:complete
MSHAPSEVQPWVLDGGAVDIPCDEAITYWRAGDTDCHLSLSDGSEVVSVRATPEVAASVRADIQARIAGGESTPVLASHLTELGLREAVQAWAAED